MLKDKIRQQGKTIADQKRQLPSMRCSSTRTHQPSRQIVVHVNGVRYRHVNIRK